MTETLYFAPIFGFLQRGGPAMWAIAALSVLTLAVILWKIWRFSLAGAWSGGRAEARVDALCRGEADAPPRSGSVRMRFVAQALGVLQDETYGREEMREEITRRALRTLSDLRAGLRVLELIAAIAPLIGLLGTVLGMIDAFQALETSGTQADAAVLAGGIWEALLTTAAGMAVAIPATIAQSWFETVVERLRQDLEDFATRLFARLGPKGP